MTVRVPVALLEEARELFEREGAEGREATALIAVDREGNASRLVVPDQESGVCPDTWVRVTERGKLELVAALDVGERYAARIHSHPCEAFHSRTDDANPALTFEGALSIVVPFFGLGLRRGLDACAVYALRDRRWRDVPVGARRTVLVAA